jgi:hypothetical protein
MKFVKFTCAVLSLSLLAGIAMANGPYTDKQINEDNARVDAIVRNIQTNGPQELRRLNPMTIRNSASSFVTGERLGVISPSQMAQMGGAEQATKSSLMGQLRALGGR